MTAQNMLLGAGQRGRPPSVRHCCGYGDGHAGAWIEALESRRLLAADLGVELGSWSPLSFYTPGDSFNIPFAVRNTGVDAFTGYYKVTAHYLRSPPGGGAIAEIGTPAVMSGHLTALAADTSQALTFNQLVTRQLLPGTYSVRFDLALFSDAGLTVPVPEDSLGDNSITTFSNCAVRWIFGTFGGRSNVTMRLADDDGTQFTMSLTGNTYGEVSIPSPPRMTIDVGTGTQGVPYSVTAAVVAGSAPGSTIDVQGQITLHGSPTAFTAPLLNISSGGLSSESTMTGAGPAITLRNLTDSGVSVLGNAAAMRIGSITNTSTGRPNGLLVTGNAASVTAGSVTGVLVTVRGTCGPMTLGNISDCAISMDATAGAITALNITGSDLTVIAGTPSLTARTVADSAMHLNTLNPGTAGSMSVLLGTVSDTTLATLTPIASLNVDAWTTAGPGHRANLVLAPAITLLTTRVLIAGPDAGSWRPLTFITGGLSRPTQLGTVTIAGELSGSFIVGGSVGTITAASVNSGAPGGNPAGGWAPAVASSGTIGSFTTSLLRSGVVWATAVRNLTLNAVADNSRFELSAGLRLNRPDIPSGMVSQVLLGNGTPASPGATWGGGAVGTITVNLRHTDASAATGFQGRFVAGMPLTGGSALPRASGALDFAAAGGALRRTADIASRVDAIRVTGPLTGNSLQFAFRNYPTARFAFGTPSVPPVGVLIPATPTSIATPGVIAGVLPAATFFRVGIAP